MSGAIEQTDGSSVGTILSGLGGALKAGGTLAAGKAEAGALDDEALQYDAIAKQARATSQRKAIEEVRAGKVQESRVQALVAASGAGATDPSVVDAMARMAGDSQYAKDVALYDGEVDARNNERTASARRGEARAVKQASKISALSTLLSTGSTMFDRYGGGDGRTKTGKASVEVPEWRDTMTHG